VAFFEHVSLPGRLTVRTRDRAGSVVHETQIDFFDDPPVHGNSVHKHLQELGRRWQRRTGRISARGVRYYPQR
jgi:hypothetical protein